ncbi:MAG: hypothetical protein HUU10_01610 [Bacteroidetes bacterium]|nr:hypothetical protein [Bacteroidota bacterium]
MIRAVLDIGTNTVLMTIQDTGNNRILGDYSSIARLGEGLQKTGKIGADAIGRLGKILTDYLKIMDKTGVSHCRLIATSAMRDASNRQEVIDQIQRDFGLTIEVISGDEEAQYTYSGGLTGLNPDPSKPIGLIDIGGGSTEYIIGTTESIRFKKSLNMGTVRYSEQFHLHSENPESFDLDGLRQEIKRQLSQLQVTPPSDTQWVGVAGTPTSLSAAFHQLKKYEATVVHGSVLSLGWLESNAAEFSKLPPKGLLERYPIFGKRYDLILAGTIILTESLRWAGTDQLMVSDHGLRYGVLNAGEDQNWRERTV